MKFKNNKSGAVLAFSIIISLALVIISTALYLTVTAATKQATLGYDERQAYLYSKSGIEYAKSIAYYDLKDNGRINNTIFYVSGDTPSGLNVSNNSSANIYTVFCATEYQTEDENGNTKINYDFNIVSTSKYKSSNPVKITYSGKINMNYNGASPLLPSDYDPGLLSSNSVAWYKLQEDGTGVLQKGSNISGTAAFSIICFVANNSTANADLAADRIYFMKSPALIFKKNMGTTLTADFFSVNGDFQYENERGNADFYIKPRNHAISGNSISSLGASSNVNYGIIYFAPHIKVFGTDLGGSLGKYYFFPSGVDLCDITASNLNGLIAIDDITKYSDIISSMGQDLSINFDPSTISIGGSIS